MEVVERRYYTTFAIEAGVSFTTIAGTLAEIGPFKVCTIAFPNIRAFRKWVEKRQAEVAEQARAYFEHERQVQAELAERRQREAQEQALLEEAEQVAYRRAHAVELAAEQVAGAVWPTDVPKSLDTVFSDDELGDLDDHPF